MHSADDLTPAVRLSMNTGLGRGEFLKLRWGFVDFNRRLRTIEDRNVRRPQTRQLPLNEDAVSVLRNLHVG